MSLGSAVYNSLFKRTSTFMLAAVGSVFFFERTFELAAEQIFQSVNRGKLYQDMKKE